MKLALCSTYLAAVLSALGACTSSLEVQEKTAAWTLQRYTPGALSDLVPEYQDFLKRAFQRSLRGGYPEGFFECFAAPALSLVDLAKPDFFSDRATQALAQHLRDNPAVPYLLWHQNKRIDAVFAVTEGAQPPVLASEHRRPSLHCVDGRQLPFPKTWVSLSAFCAAERGAGSAALGGFIQETRADGRVLSLDHYKHPAIERFYTSQNPDCSTQTFQRLAIVVYRDASPATGRESLTFRFTTPQDPPTLFRTRVWLSEALTPKPPN